MKPFPMIILEGTVVAGYAAKECVAHDVRQSPDLEDTRLAWLKERHDLALRHGGYTL